MNVVDFSILTQLNGFANASALLDALLIKPQQNNLLKGGVFLAVWWGLWFRETRRHEQAAMREKLMCGLIAMTLGLFLARALAYVLPFRVRPFVNPELHFVIPSAVRDPSYLEAWSSFPSDHAVVWFSLVAIIFLAHRGVGCLAFLYALYLSIGRIYGGWHYPTDIMAGAAIGFLLVYAVNYLNERKQYVTKLLGWGETMPAIFYTVLFLSTYQISNMFDEVRAIAKFMFNLTV